MSTILIGCSIVVIVAVILYGLAECYARLTYIDYRDESADDHRR